MKKLLWAMTPAVILAACNGQSGADYVGKWTRQHTEHQMSITGEDRADVIQDTLTIERNGEGYLLRSHRLYRQGNGAPTSYPENTTPAVLKDGQLQVAGGLASYAIDKKTGHLIAPDGQGEYKR